jgi:OOP family OmpA-OmpF porin
MKIMKLGTQGLIALAILACTQVSASEPGWYGGFNLGKSNATIDDERIVNDLLSQGFTQVQMADDDKDNGWKLFAGYQVNKNLAFEGGYFDLGEYSFTATTLPAGTLNGNVRFKGVNLDVVGILPMTEKLSAFARAGLNAAKANSSFNGTGLVNVLDPNHNERDINYKVGVGLEYAFTESLSMRAEAERYRLNDTLNNRGDVDLISLGLVYRFNKAAPVQEPQQTPVVVEPEVVPVPAVVVVPEVQATQEYCSVLDMEFEIDKDTIQREEKERINTLGTFLTKYPETTAVIEGHSDNVGDSQYNMQLSLRRAQSVVAYLVDTVHINPNRLTSVGYGDTRPLSDNQTEDGKRMNRRIDAVIACATDIEGLTVAPTRVTMAMHMEFDKNKEDVKPEYASELRKVANFLKANPTTTATVEGHTGNIQATPELAMAISQRRAENVVNYLVDNHGIARSRLTAEGFGQTRRTAYNATSEGQQENRRVNIIINYAKKQK